MQLHRPRPPVRRLRAGWLQARSGVYGSVGALSLPIPRVDLEESLLPESGLQSGLVSALGFWEVIAKPLKHPACRSVFVLGALNQPDINSVI